MPDPAERRARAGGRRGLPLWQLTLIEAGLALAVALLAASEWRARSDAAARARWPASTATVTAVATRNLARGTETVLRARHEVGGRGYDGSLRWGPNAWRDGQWGAPPDTPAVGATLVVRYNPAQPDELARAATGAEPSWLNVTVVLAAVLVAIGAAAAWALPRR